MKLVTQKTIKSVNTRRIYDLIWKNSGISRASTAEKLMLSKTTVSTLVDDLINKGLVLDIGVTESTGQGRKPNGLTVNSKNNAVGIIHWQGKGIDVAIVDTNAEIVYSYVFFYNENEDPVLQMAGAYKKISEELKGRRLLGLVLIVPGIVDERRRSIYSTVLSLDVNNDVLMRLRQAIPEEVPMAVFNDTACYAYAEEEFGKIKSNCCAIINLNKGIGAALLIDGKILRGAGGMSAQFGHYSIDSNGPSCICGNRGCLELMVGESALKRRAAQCGVSDIFSNKEEPTFQDIGNLAANGNKGALSIIEVISEDFSFAIANLITFYNPELIILGGRGTLLGPLFLDKIRKKLMNRGFGYFMRDKEVRYSRLGEQSVLQGAAIYFMRNHFTFFSKEQKTLFLS